MRQHLDPNCPARYPSTSIDPNATIPICRCIQYPVREETRWTAKNRIRLALVCAYVAGVISTFIALGNRLTFMFFTALGILFLGAVYIATRTEEPDES